MNDGSEFSLSELQQFSGGSDTFYQHPICRRVTFTAGIAYLAEHAGAHWLVDKIAINQVGKRFKQEGFQVWTLTVADHSGVLNCTDGDGSPISSEKIEFTNFPAEKVTLWCVDNSSFGFGMTIMLPCEY